MGANQYPVRCLKILYGGPFSKEFRVRNNIKVDLIVLCQDDIDPQRLLGRYRVSEQTELVVCAVERLSEDNRPVFERRKQ